MWLDPETRKKPEIDESAWAGYGVEYEQVRDFIKQWIAVNTKGLDASLVATLRENYQVIPAGPGASHNTIMGANDNLQGALADLPRAASAPTTAAPKTIAPKRVEGVQVQRQGASGAAPLTEAQHWDADWTAYPAQRAHFAASGRPTGTPRQRYDVLCPLYKAHGIARPMVYMATSVTTATFYRFSTPAHNGMATALASAEAALRAKGHATAPVTSVWALNARTTSTGAWSNHADGKAVDTDPDTNPHLVDKTERKTISLVTGNDMEPSSQGYDALKGASDRFTADYNPAGMQRRITELLAAETARQAARDTVSSEGVTLKGQRDALNAERLALQQQLKSLPHGAKATADDLAKAAAVTATLRQNEANGKQVATGIKQKALELKAKESDLRRATKDRDLLEKERTKYVATEELITGLEGSVDSLPREIAVIDLQIAQSKQDEHDAQSAGHADGAKAQQALRSTLQKTLAKKKITLKSKETQLDKRKRARDEDPLRRYAADGFLNVSKDLVEAMMAAGLRWGGDWGGAKDFMHFEL